jgi:urease accessory protein
MAAAREHLVSGMPGRTDDRIILLGDARFIGWELLCLGRPAANQSFCDGFFRPSLELWREGVPLLFERAQLYGKSATLSAPWGLAARAVWGTLLAFPARTETLDAVCASGCSAGPNLFSATLLDKLLVCRFLGHEAEAARASLTSAWEVIRPLLFARPTCPPRIWRT